MSDHEDLLAWATLAGTPGLDTDKVSEALNVWGSAPAVAKALRPIESSSARGSADDALRRWLESPDHRLIPFTDPRFPKLLLPLQGCPIVLYLAGSVAALDEPQLAIVGSRSPTPQGRENAKAFAQELGMRGLGITSGLAEGIDASAHRGALDAKAITLAVLGTGIDRVYPACNRMLSAEIERGGALVSSFALGTPPRRGNFPQRNRLIAGLCLGTLVVEAAHRSGSLITARAANTYGREVFAIPGSIHNPASRGCHALIKAGAKLVETADDILGELNFSAFFDNDLRAQPHTKAGFESSPARGPTRDPTMDKDRKILLDALGFDPADLDTLVVRTGFKPDAVSSMMLILELEGHVQAAPGGRYSRVAHRRAGGER
jgi:DNA processing protein